MNKKLSIIIVAYNNINILKQCLDSLYSFNDIGEELEIIISDNSIHTKVYEYVKKNYQGVKIVHNCKNGGFGYGNNRGYELSVGEYLLFLNPDTYLIDPIFDYCVGKFENDKELVAFGLRLVKPNMERNFSYGLLDGFGIIDWIRILYFWRRHIFLEGEMFTSGANLFIRREVFENIGGFDENIFMYFEESDLLHRLIKLKPQYKMRYFDDKMIVHLEGATQRDDANALINSYKRELEALKYYCKKHHMSYKDKLRKNIRLFYMRLLKYCLKNEKQKIETEKRIIELAKSAINS